MAMDRWIGYHPAWGIAYHSIYAFLPIFPWLAISRIDLTRYALGFTGLCAASFLVFFFFPVEAPRANLFPETLMNQLLGTHNGKLNAFPSLHAGLVVCSLLFGLRTLPHPGRNWLIATACIWGAGILFAALATKQHYAVDLPAGMMLAWVFHKLVWSINHKPFYKEEYHETESSGHRVMPVFLASRSDVRR